MERYLAMDGSNSVASRSVEVAAPAVWVALLATIGVGLAVRLHGLGQLGLVVDEGNQALAIAGILERGIPIGPSGWPYPRNLLFQYFQAASAVWFGLSEFALRLPSVLFGTASILSAFHLARALFGRRVALVTAVLVCLSIWELSFSRYARPYTALQFLYTLGLLCYYRGFLQDERRFRLGFFAVVIVLLPIHEFSAGLATCFAIPFLLGDAWPMRRKLNGLALGAVIGAAWVVYQRVADALVHSLAPVHGLSHMPAIALPEAEILWWSGPRIAWPDFSALEMLAGVSTAALVLPAAIAVAAVVTLLLRAARSDRLRTLLLCAVIGAACLHQFGLAILFALTDVVLYGRRRENFVELGLPSWLAVGLSLAFWSLFLVIMGTGWRETVLQLFGYPNVLQHCLYFLGTGWPVISIGAAAAALLLTRQLVREQNATAAAFALGSLMIPIVAMSFFRAYFEARYIFHLFPLLLALYAYASLRLADEIASRAPAASRGAVVASVVVVALLVSGEANPLSAWQVGQRTHAARLDPAKGVISWEPYADFHQDHRTPSRYVIDHRGSDDRVVVMGAPHMVGVYTHYLGPIDFSIARPADLGYMRLRGSQRVSWLTGTPVITDADELRTLLAQERGGAIWLVGDRALLSDDNAYYDESMKALASGLAVSPDYVGLDGHTFATRLP